MRQFGRIYPPGQSRPRLRQFRGRETSQAQDLAPRAYVITPLHSNAIILTWALYDGNIDRTIRSHQADQLGRKSLGLQTRVCIFATLAKWVLDGYMGVSLFTTNNDFWSHNSFYPGTRSQSQAPIGAFEGHLSYDFKPRLWASLDGNYRFGGKTSINGVQNPLTQESNSRLGGTVSIPITKHQSLKFGLQQWHLHPVRRQLSERLSCLAIFVAGKTQVAEIPV